ncbi:Stealth CR1 domain-containing protein [uncultured Polaribacter sp.]|uniref:Stealth CR1 domain-containing protein n=1 Tax=uncultured Polaribacter sp. TaxID=174711 RepID=UPI00260D4E62|nr:Stealth CR1 domain-containing protein [uncultured Polaribacter sp.]
MNLERFENNEIDAVITWVDGHDYNHREKMKPFVENLNSMNNINFRSRFDHVNEIEFSVKSIRKFAKFIRNIFIVTDNQIPGFLKDPEKATREFPNVFIVDHKVIFEGYHKYLPTFNSMSIESLLYKIPNLSERFIYLNDDFFLLNDVKISDFFIGNKTVIRGVWTSFYEDIWYKKFQKKIFQLIGKDEKINAFGFKKSQQLIVKKLGFKKYVRLDHSFTAMRKSTFEKYYLKNSKMLEENIKYRFRSHKQFLNQSLAVHLEIKNNTFILNNNYQLVNFQNYKKPFFWIKYKLKNADKNKNRLFLCMQSLDKCPKEKLNFIKKWLSVKYN